MIRIDRDIPVPKQLRPGRKSIYPFRLMVVGDSFLLAPEMQAKVGNAAKQWKKRHPGWNYRTRVTSDGVRVWRVS